MRKLFIVTAFVLLSCDSSDEKPELIDRTRAVLVELNPIANPEGEEEDESQPEAPTEGEPAVFGGPVTLVFHFLSPDLQSELTAASADPVAGPEVLPLTISEVAKKDYPGLRHFRVKATAMVPVLPLTQMVKLRYALIANDGQKSYRVEGDIPVFPNGDTNEARWTVARSEIESPTGDAVPAKVDLTAKVVNPQNEGVKVAWFVSAGDLNNRRDAMSEWKLPGPGRYTAVLTVRGQKSRTAALRFRTVTYQ